ncbi:MAG: maleylacetoacetate isomerase [Myxococcota bacterium]
MRLYGYWRSTSSWRVRLALALKNIQYDNHPVHLVKEGGLQRTDDYRKMNPMQQVPLLEWNEGGQVHRLAQSVAICEFLEQRHPDPSLLPADALLRARTRALVEVINAGIQPLQNLRLLQTVEAAGIDKVEWAARWIRDGFTALETMLQDTSGTFCVGDTVTLADVFLVPQIYNARRFKVDLSSFPTIVGIDEACASEPAFMAAHPDRQPDAPPSA